VSKNLEELKKSKHDYEDYLGRDMPVVLFMQHCINLLEDFEKRLAELEKYNILEYNEINKTGGINNIKIVLDDPNKKRKEIV